MTRAGYNVVYAWCKAMLAKRLDTTDIDIPKLPYSCMVEDSEFRSNVCRGRVSLWQFLKDVKHCDYFTYWDKRDNGPFWAIMRRMFKRALKRFSTDMNILKKTYRKLTSRKYNIGFVENTLEESFKVSRTG